MTKNIILVSLVLLGLVAGNGIAYGQENSLKTKKVMERGEQEMEQKTEKMERLSKHTDKVMGRLKAAVARLTRLLDRVESRIKKFEDIGADMAEAKALLPAARQAIAGAEGALLDLEAKMTTIIGNASSTPRAQLQTIRPLVKMVVDELKTAHAHIVHIITLLKAKNK